MNMIRRILAGRPCWLCGSTTVTKGCICDPDSANDPGVPK